MILDRLLNDFSPSSAALTRVVLEVFRLNGLLLAHGDLLSQDAGLTSARWQVLAAVRIAGEPLTVAQIARNMGLTRQGVQRNVDLLQRDGLLAFKDNPQHKRAKWVVLTRSGEAAAEQMRAIHRDWADQQSADLDVDELKAALVVLQKLRERLERE
jgi:DNA-binding MarR family transcriptional regulator